MKLPLSLTNEILSRETSTAIPKLTLCYPNMGGKLYKGVYSFDLHNGYPFPPFPNQSYIFNPNP